jgi:integrase
VSNEVCNVYRSSSLSFWRTHIDNYLVPHLGEYRLDRIDVKTVEEFRDKLSVGRKPGRGLSPRTVNKILTTGSAIFKFAMRHGLVRTNPFALAERLRSDSKEIREWDESGDREETLEENVYSTDEIARLLDAAEPGRDHTMFLTAALTGIRHGDLLALQWGDFDLEAGKMTVRRSVSWAKAPNGEEDNATGIDLEPSQGQGTFRPVFKFTKPKTAAGIRTIPLAPELVSALRRWKLQCPPSDLELVFASESGHPLQRKSVLNALHRTQRRAKLRQLDIKALRHSFASLLIAAGRSVTEVQYLMGHANPMVTLRVYSHWLKKTETTGVSDLAKAIFTPKGASTRQNSGHSADTPKAK